MMLIGDRIKQRRESLKMTQEDLAKTLGYKSRSSINKIENNENDIPQSRIAEIAKALEISPATLMFGTEADLKHVEPKEFPPIFKDPVQARKYLSMHQVLGSEGMSNRDIEEMSDEKVLKFANEVMNLFGTVSYKYR